MIPIRGSRANNKPEIVLLYLLVKYASAIKGRPNRKQDMATKQRTARVIGESRLSGTAVAGDSTGKTIMMVLCLLGLVFGRN